MNRRRFFTYSTALLAAPAVAALPKVAAPAEGMVFAGGGAGGATGRTVVIRGLAPEQLFSGEQVRRLLAEMQRELPGNKTTIIHVGEASILAEYTP